MASPHFLRPSLTVLPALLFACVIDAAAPVTYNPGCSIESLVSAVTQANGTGGTINLAPGCDYAFPSKTSEAGQSALPLMDGTTPILIEGHGAKIRRIASGNAFRLVYVELGATVTLRDLTVEGGQALRGDDGVDATQANGPKIFPTDGRPGSDGGAIYNSGSLTLDGVTVQLSRAGDGGRGGNCANFRVHVGWGATGGRGGGVYNTGTLLVKDSVFTRNAAGNGGAGGGCPDWTDLDDSDTSQGGNGADGGAGGAIWSEPNATVTLQHSRLFQNSAGAGGAGGFGNGDHSVGQGGVGGDGGGILNKGTLTIEDSTLDQNGAGQGGMSYRKLIHPKGSNYDSQAPAGSAGRGGAVAALGGSFEIDRSTLAWNAAGAANLGATPDGTLQMGHPGKGGALYTTVLGAIENSTLASNAATPTSCQTITTGFNTSGFPVDETMKTPAGFGGGIAAVGTGIDIRNVTFSGNVAGGASSCRLSVSFVEGGVGGALHNDGGDISFWNTILSSPSSDNCAVANQGRYTSRARGNLVWGESFGSDLGDLACPDAISADPKLGEIPKVADLGATPVADPPTLPPAPGSGAINAGDAATCDALGIDQRGVERPQGAHCDIGAVELRAPSIVNGGHPVNASVVEGATAAFSATFEAGEGGSPSARWQRSTDGGATWAYIAGAENVSATGGTRYRSNYTTPATVRGNTGSRFRVIFANSVAGATTNAATLTVTYSSIVSDLSPVTQTANVGAHFTLAMTHESSPAFTSEYWQVTKDGGKTWGNAFQVGAFPRSSSPVTVTLPFEATHEMYLATVAHSSWRYRVTLSGGTHQALQSREVTVDVTNDPNTPRFVAGPTYQSPIDEGAGETIRFWVSGNPTPEVGWQRSTDQGGTWVDIPGAPYTFNTTPTKDLLQGDHVTLTFGGWAFQEADYRAVLTGWSSSQIAARRNALASGRAVRPLTTAGFPPSIDSISPTSGAPGTLVSISGMALDGVTAVSFNGVAAKYTFTPGGLIKAKVPLHAFSGRITVITDGGTTESHEFFDVQPGVIPPTIDWFFPPSAIPGSVVTIYGANLDEPTQVKFGDTPVTQLTVVSYEEIKATVPIGAANGPIRVVTADFGTGVSQGDFQVLPGPAIASYSPTFGLPGTLVTFTGTNLDYVQDVEFNGTSAASVTIVSQSKATAVVPAGATSGDLTITTLTGVPSNIGTFFIGSLPVVSSFTPTNGGAGASVTLTGSSFTGASAVLFNGAPCFYTVDSDTQITAKVPLDATTGPIGVTTIIGTGTSTASFTVTNPAFGRVTSQRVPIFVRVETAMTLDCPRFAAAGSTFTCTVTVTAKPKNGPRPRKVAGTVSFTGPVAGGTPRCDLDANGRCSMTFLAPPSSTVSTITARYPYRDNPFSEPFTLTPVDQPSEASVEVTSAACGSPFITEVPADRSANADPLSCKVPVPDFRPFTRFETGGCSEPPTVTQVPAPGTLVNAGTHTVTITVANQVDQASRTAKFSVRDVTPPVLVLNGDATMYASCNTLFEDPGATARDACDGEMRVYVDSQVDTGRAGSHTLTYHTFDFSENFAQPITRTVIVQDNQPPVITLFGPEEITVECHDTFHEPGFMAQDACEGRLETTTTSGLDMNTPGTYDLAYNVSDSSGHAAAPKTRKVVVKDTIKPVVTLNGLEFIELECGTSYVEPGATATDLCAGGRPVTITGTVDDRTPGEYILRYDASDPSGNAAETKTRRVHVVGGGQPNVTLNGPASMTLECHALFQDFGAIAVDGCGRSLTITTTGSVNPNAPGTYTLVYKATDWRGAIASATRELKVVDTTKPTLSCPANIHVAATPGTCGAAVTFTVTASDVCAGSLTPVLSHASGSTFPLGVTTVTANVADASGNSSFCSFTVTVTTTPTATSLALSNPTPQYSDPETLTATVKDSLTNAPVSGGTVTFRIGGSTVGTSAVGAGGVATLALNLVESAILAKADLSIGGHQVTATYNGNAACYATSADAKTLTVAREDALVTYTGLSWAPACLETSAVVTLSATVKDVSAVDPALSAPSPDTFAGNVANATITFVDRDKGNAVLCSAPIGLVSSADKATGTAACNATMPLGDYHIGLVVGGLYVRNHTADDQVLEVATSCGTGIITGGGYLTLQTSSGAFAGDKLSKENFGFNVKYNKSNKNLQGTINTIIRKQGRLYQVKGNSMTSLVIDSTKTASHPYPTATFFGKASLQDVTDPLNPIPLPNGGGAILRVEMTDKDEPGKGSASSTDTIAITVWYSPSAGGGLFFSSSWNGSTTLEQPLGGTGGGNLSVK